MSVSMSEEQARAHFVAFVTDHTAALMRTAVLVTRSPQRAEDLVQDTLAALLPKWRKVALADSDLAYVRRALLNRYLSNSRRRSGSVDVSDSRRDAAEARLAPDIATQIADRDHVHRLLSGLPARQRAAIVLRFYHDLNDAETAKTLGCRVGTARSLISRALATMRTAPVTAVPLTDSHKEMPA